MENFNRIGIYTDLAMEVAETILKTAENETDGIEMRVEKTESPCEITTTTVRITNENGEIRMGKPLGSYITIEAPALRKNEVMSHEEIIKKLSEKLLELQNISESASVLIVGLGNRSVTPDSLGPRVVAKVLVTRHIMDTLPSELNNTTRPVSAITPGVMGITGIETYETVKGICERVKPDLVIAIDALAARHSKRVNAAIQLSDTGISPGSGVNNKRARIDGDTLGVPVIGIGVPTVVDAATLVNDTMDMILESMSNELTEGSAFFNMLHNLESEEKYKLIRRILDPHMENMFVAPKEVDTVIEQLSNIIANAINISLHPGIELKDINRYIY